MTNLALGSVINMSRIFFCYPKHSKPYKGKLKRNHTSFRVSFDNVKILKNHLLSDRDLRMVGHDKFCALGGCSSCG